MNWGKKEEWLPRFLVGITRRTDRSWKLQEGGLEGKVVHCTEFKVTLGEKNSNIPVTVMDQNPGKKVG